MMLDHKQTETLSFADALAGIRSDWQNYVPRIQRHQAKVCLRSLWEKSGTGFALAEVLNESDAEWKAFVELPFWAGREVTLSRQNVLRYAMQFVFGQAVGSRADRAASFANALNDCFWGDAPLPAEDVPQFIEQSGGLEKLIEASRARKIVPPSSLAKRHSTDFGNATGFDGIQGEDTDDDDAYDDEGQLEAEHRTVSSRPVARLSKARIARYPHGIHGLQRLEVLIDANAFSALIDLEAGTEVALRVRLVDNGESAYKRIEALPPGDEG